ncbi:MAG: hypothetical protein SGI83_15980 [Bacteroidota bacterium]|nr:hypothetical protein [Bacteroidota bacterium]
MKKIVFFTSLLLSILNNTAKAQDVEINARILDSLIKRIEILKAKIDAIGAKLTFEKMSVMTLVAGDQNMISETQEGYTSYHHDIKIDNPLCNNNPNAIVLVMKQKDNNSKLLDAGRTEPASVYFNGLDKHWYLITPSWQLRGYEADITVQIAIKDGEMYGVSAGDIYFFDAGPFNKSNDFFGKHGVAYFAPHPSYPGDKFSVIIFKELLVTMKFNR